MMASRERAARKIVSQRFVKGIGNFARSLLTEHGPRLFRGLSHSKSVTNTYRPSQSLSRTIEYRPDLDGAADPGEIVWAWVAFEEDASAGKDRPLLVVGREGNHLLGLMLSSQEHRRNDPNWLSIGAGDWDVKHRESFIRLDRVLEVPEHGIRREGAILDERSFTLVANSLRNQYNWS